MVSERIQRRIDAALDEADEALDAMSDVDGDRGVGLARVQSRPL